MCVSSFVYWNIILIFYIISFFCNSFTSTHLGCNFSLFDIFYTLYWKYYTNKLIRNSQQKISFFSIPRVLELLCFFLRRILNYNVFCMEFCQEYEAVYKIQMQISLTNLRALCYVRLLLSNLRLYSNKHDWFVVTRQIELSFARFTSRCETSSLHSFTVRQRKTFEYIRNVASLHDFLNNVKFFQEKYGLASD